MAKAKWTKWSQAQHEFAPAFKTSWPYVLLGFTLGAGFIFLSEEIPDKYPLVQRMVEHLGMGFIVSAIAVFFYEWGAHIKKALELSQELVDTIREDIKPMVLELAGTSLPKLLKILLQERSSVGHRHTREMVPDIERLVTATARLQKNGIWMKEQYLDVLARSIRTLCDNAENLASLGKGMKAEFIAPTSENSTDGILAAQMKSLKEKDTYDAITHLYVWKSGRLGELRKATLEAIGARNVKVRRIFNFLIPVQLTPEEVREILLSHIEECERVGPGESLQVRILTSRELSQSTSQDLKVYIQEMHFGIFSHGSESLRIKLSKSWDLSNIELSMKREDLEASKRLFAEAWRIAKPLTKNRIADCVQLLAKEGPAAGLSQAASVASPPPPS
jgi:hypothetical protein